MLKLQEGIQQQKELHDTRMQIETEQLKTAVAARQKAEAEAELAVLQLTLFKQKHQLL